MNIFLWISMMMNDIFQKYQLISTNDEENDETEYPIDPDKPSHGATAQIDTDIPSPIAAVPIVATKAPVFKC